MNKRFSLFLIIATFIVAAISPVIASADVNDFVIRKFDGKYVLEASENGGLMTVTESIDLTFSDFNHGILRAIPETYLENDLNLEIISVERDGMDEPYSTYGQNDNLILKIGDADKTITGEHSYQIKYQASNVILFLDNHDEWYWDINGDQWQQPFLEVKGEVILPASARDNSDLPVESCYSGRLGQNNKTCTIKSTDRGYVFSTIQPLGPKETLTVATAFKKGVFVPRTTSDWVGDNLWQFVGVIAGVALSYVTYRLWKDHGKDYKGRGVIVPRYKPPEQLTPAEIGMLMDYQIDSRDLSATIIDLAIRGYLKIHEDKNSYLGGLIKNQDFKLELMKTSTSDLKVHEKQLLEAIFPKYDKNAKIRIKKISKTAMQKAIPKIKADVKEKLVDEYGLIDEAPRKTYGILSAILVATFILMFLIHGWGWSSGMAIASIFSLIFLLLMRRRSHAGVEIHEQLKGLKWYMDTAEKDRMKMMQSVERPYSEPSKTVNLFESLLPFAVAMGVEKSWAKEFNDIYSDPPAWYSGHGVYSGDRLASNLASGLSSMNNSFTQSTSSSTSGTSGGGSAGGGGGGGGGGGW